MQKPLRDELDGCFRTPHDGPPKWLAMLTLYLDESGHQGKGWTFVAGFLGNDEQWGKFVPAWKNALGKQRKNLHMNDLRWGKDYTRQLLEKLAPIPEECGLQGVMGGVCYEHYEDLIVGTPDEKLLKGYMAALHPMMTQIFRGIPKNERLEIVFEQQREYQKWVDISIPFYALPHPQMPWLHMEDGQSKLAKWSFVPKNTSVMTDPADYLAFALREAWTDSTSKKAQWCKPLLATGKGEGIGVVLTKEMVRRAVRSSQLMAMYQDLDMSLKKLGVSK